MWPFKRNPKLSVLIVFYNMQREAERTLYSLTTQYQQDLREADYEVIVLDSNSSEPLDKAWVESFQDNFHYHYIESDAPTPCRALNVGADVARADILVNHIDGARILSPGVLANMLRAESAYRLPFTYSIGMHLGAKRQNESMLEGYNQSVEDELLATVPWQTDGYSLFNISCLAGSSKEGYLFPIYESNCFSINRQVLSEIGGFDEAFRTPGGGLVNLDVFRKLMLHDATTPVLLAGEATFHQFHGGVATNVPPAEHMWDQFDEEYELLRGNRFEFIGYPKPPVLFGELRAEPRRFYLSESDFSED